MPEDRSSFVSRIAAADYQAELSGEQLLMGGRLLEITQRRPIGGGDDVFRALQCLYR